MNVQQPSIRWYNLSQMHEANNLSPQILLLMKLQQSQQMHWKNRLCFETWNVLSLFMLSIAIQVASEANHYGVDALAVPDAWWTDRGVIQLLDVM